MVDDVIIGKLKESVINYDVEGAVEAAEEAIKAKVDPLKAIEKGLAEGLKIVGKKFGEGEIFLPMLMMGARAMQEALTVLEPAMTKGVDREVAGKVVLGTVEGDIHDIGKNIVAVMLSSAGFKVYDVGTDVPPSEFVEKVKEVKPDLVGMSCLLTAAMEKMEETIEALQEAGLRDQVKVFVGGAPLSASWAEKIGADGYGENAINAVEVAQKLISR